MDVQQERSWWRSSDEGWRFCPQSLLEQGEVSSILIGLLLDMSQCVLHLVHACYFGKHILSLKLKGWLHIEPLSNTMTAWIMSYATQLYFRHLSHSSLTTFLFPCHHHCPWDNSQTHLSSNPLNYIFQSNLRQPFPRTFLLLFCFETDFFLYIALAMYSPCVVQTGLELTESLLLLCPKCWAERCVPWCSAFPTTFVYSEFIRTECRCSSVVKCLYNVHEALNLAPSTETYIA